MLRVALVTDTFAPSTNGVVRAIDTSRQALARMGTQVHAFAPASAEVRAANVDARVTLFPSMLSRLYPDLRLGLRPIRERDLRGFDVVHVHTPGPLGLTAMRAARKAGISVVYTYHTRFDDIVRQRCPTPSIEKVALGALHKFDRAILKRLDVVIAPTTAIADEIERLHDVPTEIIPSGVDIAKFRPLARTRSQPPTYLYVGRLAREKNLDALLRAFRQLLVEQPDAVLQIGGSGPDSTRLHAIAQDLGIGRSVRWLGFVAESDLPRIYGEADVFVTPSLFETQGLTVLEALASGTPAALARCRVFEPIAKRGGAILFDPRDAQETAATLVSAYERRAMLGREGLRIARDNSVQACARRLRSLYASLAREASTPCRPWHDRPRRLCGRQRAPG